MEDGTRLQCPCPERAEPIPGPVQKVVRYYAPFDKCDREEDYDTVWKNLKRREVYLTKRTKLETKESVNS
jgi:hypothetical protein